MHVINFFAIVFFLTCLVGCGGGNEKPVSNDLVGLENDWMHAMMKRDKPRLEELMAAEFTVTGIKYIDSAAVPRSMWMYNTMNDIKVDSVHFLNAKATIIDNIGIVKAYFFWSGFYNDDRFSDSTSFVDTWIKRNSGWQVVSRVITE